MTISKDRVKPSPLPDSWKLKEIFAQGVVIGVYLAVMTVIFFWAANKTRFLEDHFHVHSIRGNKDELTAAIYLQVSIISQALIFVTRSVGWSFLERPGALLMGAFCIAQLIATIIAVYANWGFAHIRGIGWGWAGVIWLYSLVTYFPLDVIKFFVRYVLSGKAWNLMLDRRTALTTKKDFGKDDRQAQWATQQRTLHGLSTIESEERTGHEFKDVPELAGEAKRRAEIARLRELHTLKGHVESVIRLKGIDMDVSQHSYTL
ncbi:hypothetical protein R1sor_008732 [Riccia sorocarpa]|uniref:Plasma membrane H+-ATPase n=1 Tax=Riccia sorocarpa TaxID=122646 RepID=A0ABD3HYE0_9MARC